MKLKTSELNRLSPAEFKSAPKLPVAVVLDNVRSLHNVGAVFRSADAFRVEVIYLAGCTAKPPHRDIQKTALGATETVSWVYKESTVDAINELKGLGWTIVAVEQTLESVPLDAFRLLEDKRYAFVFGHEVHGVAQEVVDASDICLEIPQFGTKHSLNISVCAGIVLWNISSLWKKLNQ